MLQIRNSRSWADTRRLGTRHVCGAREARGREGRGGRSAPVAGFSPVFWRVTRADAAVSGCRDGVRCLANSGMRRPPICGRLWMFRRCPLLGEFRNEATAYLRPSLDAARLSPAGEGVHALRAKPCKCSRLLAMRRCSRLVVMRGCSRLLVMRGCSRLVVMRGCSRLVVMRGCSRLLVMRGCSRCVSARSTGGTMLVPGRCAPGRSCLLRPYIHSCGATPAEAARASVRRGGRGLPWMPLKGRRSFLLGKLLASGGRGGGGQGGAPWMPLAPCGPGGPGGPVGPMGPVAPATPLRPARPRGPDRRWGHD